MELENKKLLKKISEYKDLQDKAIKEKNNESLLRKGTEKEIAQLKQEIFELRDQKGSIQHELKRTLRLYTGLFTIMSVISLAIAITSIVGHSDAILECGRWFADRLGNLHTLFSTLKNEYMMVFTFTGNVFTKLAPLWCYVITSVISLAVAVGLFFLFCWVISMIIEKLSEIKRRYKDGRLKAIISGSVAISLFYVCLYLYEQIKSIIPLNIFSVWLILSLIGVILVNFKEIMKS